MRLDVSRVGLAFLLGVSAFAAVLFVWIVPRFGGPELRLSDAYSVSAAFRDSQQLETGADVLVRGVDVGRVRAVERRGGRVEVTFTVDDRYAPIHRDATVRVGHKTALGDAYVDLKLGTPAAGAIPRAGRIPDARVESTVEFDEAFTAFGEPTVRDIRSLLSTFGRGARSRRATERWNATIGEAARLVAELRAVTDVLDGQEAHISALVQDSRAVLGELGDREHTLRTLVANGNTTLRTFADRQAAFDASLRELPEVSSSARSALVTVRPLLGELRPLVADLRALAPDLRGAFTETRPVAAHAERVIAELPRFNATAVPFLRRAAPVVELARPVTRLAAPALRNLVPAVEYLSPRSDSLAAWFSNTGAGGQRGDRKGNWVRFLIFHEAGTAFGQPGQFSSNAYPAPGDAAHNQPYVPGSYPRLRAFRP